MVPFQTLTQSLFAALVSGRGCSSSGRAVSHQHRAGCQLRPWQQRSVGSSCPGCQRADASGRSTGGPGGRFPSRLAPARGHRVAGSAHISRCRGGADGWPWEPSQRPLSERPALSGSALPASAQADSRGWVPVPAPGMLLGTEYAGLPGCQLSVCPA